MINEKVDLLIKNGEILDDVEGTSERNINRKYSALDLTLKNELANLDKIEDAIKLIKGETAFYSEYRRKNLLNLAVNLSLEDDTYKALMEIKDIYTNLRGEFSASRYLMLAAECIYLARNFIDVEKVIKDTKVAYECMKKSHRFETKREDILSAAVIAMTSLNVAETFQEINECYEVLLECEFPGSNNIELLSNVLALINLPVDEKCATVRDLATILKENKVELKKSALPILGVTAFVTDDYNKLSKEILDVAETLKENEGFKSATVSEKARNMMALILLTKDYLQGIEKEVKRKLTKYDSDRTLDTIFEIASDGRVIIGEMEVEV
ncbi:DUF4003 family protein [Clostridium sp. LIBA-8841]|uniref:DUF4003 family protein n=1 Tax=Clostridium sp. LIBA-8841 TaxID=2987530 RepID=UPI002AC79D35|nr:DUF4003 family protein [Clostridium sp. LIBA-8841]MDZ5253548.1 DUF4003 domain-containing protein [Clostridium sp. LIBA-8841]